MKTRHPLPPAAVPPEYLPVKRRLMHGHKDEFAALRQQNVRLRLLEISIFVLLWIGGGTLALSAAALADGLLRLMLQLAGIFISGVALLAFFMEVHEGMHSLLFKNRHLNYWGSLLFCIPILMSCTGSRVLHLQHHRFLGAKEDPDEYRFYTKNRLGLWLLYYGRPLIASPIYIFLIPILGFRLGSAKQRFCIVAEWALMLCLYLLAFIKIPFSVLLLAWLAPSMLAGFLIGVWGLAQHAFTDGRDPLLASRSVHASALVSFCFLNQNYHLEHHLFPEIPSYHLKRAFQIIYPQLSYALVAKSYTGFLIEFIRSGIRLEDRLLGYMDLIGW